MKKIFNEPTVEFIKFDCEDVITTSTQSTYGQTANKTEKFSTIYDEE